MADLSDIDSLKERIARIEKAVEEIQSEIGADPRPDAGGKWWGGGDDEDPGEAALTDEEAELVRGGKAIEAIKLYHERTGVGLKASKDAIIRFGSRSG